MVDPKSTPTAATAPAGSRTGQDISLQQRIRQLERENLLLQQELSLVKGSKVWRLAEIYRRFVYVRLFGWIPWLRNRLEPLLRSSWRRAVGGMPLFVRLGLVSTPYDLWMKVNEPDGTALQEMAVEVERLAWQPGITLFCRVGPGEKRFLKESLDAVTAQLYGNWLLELIADVDLNSEMSDLLREYREPQQRIRVALARDDERAIWMVTRSLAERRDGFTLFLRQGDLLAPDALLHLVRALNERPSLDVVYADQDSVDPTGRRFAPLFKPAWSPDTLLHGDCVGSPCLLRNGILQQVGGIRSRYDGAFLYELVLRLSRITEKVGHVSRILYHARSAEEFSCVSPLYPNAGHEASLHALQAFMSEAGDGHDVEPGLFPGSCRVRYRHPETPDVSIIIPTRDQVRFLKRCIDSIMEKTSYPRWSVIILDNGSREPETLAYFAVLGRDPRFRIVPYDIPFNYSKINNHAVRHTGTPYLLFMNNDTEVIEPGWLEALMEHGQRPEVGAVGALLLYSDNTVQHAGIVMGLGGLAGHPGRFLPGNEPGYCGRILGVQNLSGVTAACLLTRRQVFDEIGGFEEELSHAYNDVDFCLKIREKGYRIIYTPHARLYHHESKSRGFDDTPEKQARFRQEWRWITEHWYGILADGDPYYNPNLVWGREDFSIRTDQVPQGAAVRLPDAAMR